MLEIDKGSPVTIVYPDQADSESGALMIPNTICLIADGPNSQRARAVIERLLQADIEAQLAAGSSAQFPLNPEVSVASRANPPNSLKVMEVDFASAAAEWDESVKTLAEIFQ